MGVSESNLPEKTGVRATPTMASPPLVRMAYPSHVHASHAWTALCHPYTTSAVSLLPPVTEALEVAEQESMHVWNVYYPGLFHVPRAMCSSTMSCTSMISCRYSGSQSCHVGR